MLSRQDSQSRNIKLVIGYDGTGFSGWQRQKHDRTIQGEIESRLSVMTTEDIFLHGAGRTDAGVHADGMVAHFRTDSRISCEGFVLGLNAMLPGAIRIFHAEEADSSFHARFSSTGKQYHYSVFTGKIHPPHLRLYTLHVTGALNFNVMTQCLRGIEGTHDFSSFENSGSRDKNNCSGRGAIRTIYEASIYRESSDLFVFHFTGDGFLRNMIRNLVGTLLDAGRGSITSESFAKILLAKDRAMAGPTAPAHGLRLKKVMY